MTGDYTAHLDSFARDHLPARDQWPDLIFKLPELHYPAHLNCARALLDGAIEQGSGDRPAFITDSETWSYNVLRDKVDRIAQVLVEDYGLVPGNRVLLRAANTPMLAACWLAVAKAGGVVVATMPMLRARELEIVIDKAAVGLALCDARLVEELEQAVASNDRCKRICFFNDAELESRMARKSGTFDAVDTAADDVVLIAFTSGTTGAPKGTMHFHRDILAMCDCFPRSVLKSTADDVFIGSPPIAFTFGLGGLVAFPMRVGAASVLLENAAPDHLMEAIQRHKATICATAPTAYRMMAANAATKDRSHLRCCVSAGETLPLPTFEAWKAATGLDLIDGIGTTEMLHIFISAPHGEIRPGATGRPIPGYEGRVVDDSMNDVPPCTVGHLAVRGPTGCRYLSDPRQADYVVDGWNLTGDAYSMDEDGYFWFQARTDDMIVTAGYNVSGPEVEAALLDHGGVAECAVVAAPDQERGQIVKAFVVAAEGQARDSAFADELQKFVKQRIAPYKYPRSVAFVDSLPRTGTGKVQRFKLREQAQAEAEQG